MRKLLAKEAAQRYQTAAEVLDDLKEYPAQRRPKSEGTLSRPQRSRVLVSVAVGLLILVGVGWWFFGRTPMGDGAGKASMLSSPLTAYPGLEAYPTFSPDGNHVAFAWKPEGQDNFDIYFKLLGSNEPHQITSDPEDELSPAWSPDGGTIAFVRVFKSQEEHGKRLSVYLKPHLGSGEKKIYETHVQRLSVWWNVSMLAWSADGQSLVVPCRSDSTGFGGRCLLTLETDELLPGELYPLTFPPPECNGDIGPAFSPDGRTLAFTRFCGHSAADVYLLPLDEHLQPSGDADRLSYSNRWSVSPVWLPDGREIIYFSDEPGSGGQLFRLSVDADRTPRLLWNVGSDRGALAITGPSETGHAKLAYTVRGGGGEGIWRVRIEGGVAQPPESFIESTRGEWGPQYSPNGEQIVFISRQTGSSEVWVCDSDGDNPHQLTKTDALINGFPRWSPDGTRIVFHSRREGQADIYVVEVESGKEIRLTDYPGDDSVPSWSRDGQWVYFQSRRSGDSRLWKVPATGEKAVRVSAVVISIWPPFESSDGQWVFYREKMAPHRLWKTPLEDGLPAGEAVEVLDFPTYDYNTVAENGVYLLAARGESAQELLFHDLSTGETQVIAQLDHRIETHFGVSPDGGTILYAHREGNANNDLMLLENVR